MNLIALDDELPALQIIEHYCSEMEDVCLKKAFSNPHEALHYIRNFPVDVILLDINMPTITGLDFYNRVKDDVLVIFTTAYHEFAINAFDLGAIDYLLKPFSQDRFRQAIKKAAKYLNQQTQESGTLTLRIDYKLVQLQLKEILVIQGYDDYVKIYSSNARVIVVRSTLKSILDKLPAADFIRVHRSYIVCAVKVNAVRNKVLYIEDKEIPLGKAYESEFMRLFLNKGELGN